MIRLAQSLPVGDESRRAILAALKAAAEDEEGGPSKGGFGGSYAQFLMEVGDQKVRNPDTGNEVKVKSLKGPKGKALLQKEFEKWKKSQDKAEGGSRGKKKSISPKEMDGIEREIEDTGIFGRRGMSQSDSKKVQELIEAGADHKAFTKILNDNDLFEKEMKKPTLKGPTKKLWDYLKETTGGDFGL